MGFIAWVRGLFARKSGWEEEMALDSVTDSTAPERAAPAPQPPGVAPPTAPERKADARAKAKPKGVTRAPDVAPRPPTTGAKPVALPKRAEPGDRAEPRSERKKRKAKRWNPAAESAARAPSQQPQILMLPREEAERRFGALASPVPHQSAPVAPEPSVAEPPRTPHPEPAPAPPPSRPPADDAHKRPSIEDRRREEDAWRAWAVAPRAEAALAEAERALAAWASAEDDTDRRTKLPAIERAQGDLVAALRLAPPDELAARARAAIDALAEPLRMSDADRAAARQAAASTRLTWVQAAEAAADLPDLKAASAAFQEAWAGWTGSPRLAPDQTEPLFQRLRAARGRLDARWEAHKSERSLERGEKLGRLQRLADQAERLAQARDPFAAAEQAKALQASWKAVHAGKSDEADAHWARFRAACDAVFARRAEARTVSDAANLEARRGIVARALALAEAGDLADPDGAIAGLMREWKRIRPGPRAEADALWAELRAACDRLRNPPPVEGTSVPDGPALAFQPFAGLGASKEDAS